MGLILLLVVLVYYSVGVVSILVLDSIIMAGASARYW